MKFFLFILNSYQIDRFGIILILVPVGLFTYFLTSSLLSYIPQELLKKNMLKFKKDKKV